MSGNLSLRLVTSTGTALNTTAESVRLWAADGSIGIRPGHPEAVILLAKGALSYTQKGVSHSIEVNGGFARVKDNIITVISE